jgi:hypothetical protein
MSGSSCKHKHTHKPTASPKGIPGRRGSAGRILNISWLDNALLEGSLELWKRIHESLENAGSTGVPKEL